ncbi:hypothetical protein C8R48DRAFT_589180, partial [Suillus tomentosus]
LCMANRSEVPSHGIWTGIFQWNKVKVRTSFEVFDSRGAWSLLIGKPLLEQLQAVHNYTNDTIMIPQTPQPISIKNGHSPPTMTQWEETLATPSPCFIIVSVPADVLEFSTTESSTSVKVDEKFVFQV